MRRTPIRHALALAGALAVAACAGEADDAAITGGGSGGFAASADYLTTVAERAGDATYRYEVDIAIEADADGRSMDVDAEAAMSGEADGELSSMTIDTEKLVPGTEDQLPPDRDLAMRAVTDGAHVYIEGSYFRSLRELAASQGRSRSATAALGSLADLEDDDWARVDLDGLTMAEVASTTGAQPADPSLFLDIAARGSDIEDLGTQEIDGVDARGLAATATYEDMIVAQGIDLDEVRAGLADSGAGADVDEVYDAAMSTEVDLEVWVDRDDRVRRVDMDLDMAPVLDALGGGGDSLVLGMTLRVADYDDPSIAIEIPDASVDVTDDFLAFSEGTGSGSPLGS